METVTTALTTMATNVGTNITSVMGDLLPALAAVVSIGIVVRFGVKWIQRLAK